MVQYWIANQIFFLKLIGHNILIAYERVIYKVTSILLSWSNDKGGLYSGIVMIVSTVMWYMTYVCTSVVKQIT